MELENLEILPLHRHPEYMKQCCDLINEEWPRSETARMMSLQASCDLLPTSLILVSNKKAVVGHCKLTPIPSIPESCFIESVVISKALRGRKLGTLLMRRAEEYCKNILKLTMTHLSTKGQENFYAKLGYEVCAPVSIYGGYLPFNSKSLLSPSYKIENPVPIQKNTPSHGVPPPPPPPPPPKRQNENSYNNNHIKSSKTYMCKVFL